MYAGYLYYYYFTLFIIIIAGAIVCTVMEDIKDSI